MKLKSWDIMDIMVLPKNVKADEGPLSPPGGRDFPSILIFQLRYEARKEALALEGKMLFVMMFFVLVWLFMFVLLLMITQVGGTFFYFAACRGQHVLRLHTSQLK